VRRFCLFLSLLAGALVPATARAEDIVVKRAPGASAADIRDDAGVQLVDSLPIPRVQVVQAADGAQALSELNDDPRVEYAEPDRQVRIDTLPTTALLDPFSLSYDWGLVNTGLYGTADDDIDAEEAWMVTTGAGATVAVVDTGIDAGHPDLTDQIAAGGYDFVDGDATPQDGNGHGTHVAGTIAAEVNGVGITGVAPNAKIVPLRVLGNDGRGATSAVAAAFARAGDLHIPVVNASLGGDTLTQVEEDAIASHPGTLYVVAAGNDGTDNDYAPHYPCNDPETNVLCVGASDADDLPAYFSNYGAASVDLFAPGVDIVSDYPRGLASSFTTGYEDLSGTSMATPHAAGVAALVASLHPTWSGAQIKQRLMDSVEVLPSLRGLAVTGGRLNAARAVGDVDVIAPAAPAGLRANAGNGRVTLSWQANGEADLAGYRVYRDGAAPEGTTATSYVAAGLTNGAAVTFRVTALDGAGNESAPAVVSATPSAPPPPIPPPAPPQVVPPTPTVTAPPAPALSAVALHGRVCARCRATLRFRLSAVSQVRFTLQRTGGRRTSRVVAFPAGAQRVTIGKTLLGMRLKPGRWTLTVALGAAGKTLRFTVAR
jgi:subtilisin family serine protease